MWLGVLVLSIEADSHLEEEEDSAFCTEEDSSSVKKIANSQNVAVRSLPPTHSLYQTLQLGHLPTIVLYYPCSLSSSDVMCFSEHCVHMCVCGVHLLVNISAFLTQWMWLGVLVLSIEADSPLEEVSAFCTECRKKILAV